MPRVTLRALVVFTAVSWTACGASSGTRPATDDDVRAVQIAEARQDASFGAATSTEVACADACSAAARVCEDQRTICALARETEDLDLRARCDSAAQKCTRAAHATEDRCPCAVNRE